MSKIPVFDTIVTMDKADKKLFLNAPRNVSDTYFYLELLRSVGPEASNNWLGTVVAEKSNSTPSPTNTSASISSSRPSSWNRHGIHMMPAAQQDNIQPTTTCESQRSDVTERVSAADPDQLPQMCCNGANLTKWTALDIELTAEPSDNLGLLFTDAAHIVLQECEFRKLRSQRRKSTSF